MNLKGSDDTVIRLLTKQYTFWDAAECGSVIGMDDYTFKKWHTYGNIIVDDATHMPVAIFEGRDGSAFKEWLLYIRQVGTVIRDRVSACVSTIQGILPDTI